MLQIGIFFVILIKSKVFKSTHFVLDSSFRL